MSCAAERMLRRSWLIRATAMAEFGEPLSLMQFMRQRALHRGQRRLGEADLVVASAWRDHP